MPFILLCLLLFSPCLVHSSERKTVRIGHFPNVTHTQGVIGHALSREGKGWFEERLGKEYTIEWYVYDAGPSAMEGILADSIDLTYVGPSPTINAYMRAKGEEVRIVAGACSGGAALIVHRDGNIKDNKDFKGKRIGTPGFSNTQDIAARSWLKSLGYYITPVGGDVLVVPSSPADLILLFTKKNLDGVWTVEPWVSNLVLNHKGEVYLEESSLWKETKGKYVTTHLVSSQKFLKEHPHLLKKIIKAHVELTEWIHSHTEEAKELIAKELKKETRIEISSAILNRSRKQLELTVDPISFSLFKYAKEAHALGFIKTQPKLDAIYDLQFLNEILKEKGKKTIEVYGERE